MYPHFSALALVHRGDFNKVLYVGKRHRGRRGTRGMDYFGSYVN